MCAAKMVRFIKKCLRGEESTAPPPSEVSSDAGRSAAPGPADNLRTVRGPLLTDGSPSNQTNRRPPKASGRTAEKRKNRGLKDILQSQNICSINASSFSKDPYGPLLDVTSHESFQSQPNIYLDSKGTDVAAHQLSSYRTHPQPRHLNHSRTNLQHLPYHQVSLSPPPPPPPPTRSVEAAPPDSQKHLHHLFPVSVRRSMDGEGVDSDKRRRSPIRCEHRLTCPPPNRTVVSS